MRRSRIAVAIAVAIAGLVLPGLVRAAELPVRARIGHPRIHTLYCGPCGCLGVAYVYHREIRSTYGLGFDPRNYDTTQPHFYLGRMRAWPRYFVRGGPFRGPCRD